MLQSLEKTGTMCYNVYIMRKFCFFIIFTALFLCGCEKKQQPEYVFHENSPLTTMTTITTIPADTYSEYMATYTPSETTDTDLYHNHLSRVHGVSADTGMISHDKQQLSTPSKDTAVMETTQSEIGAETTVPYDESTYGETTETVYSLERPPADTAYFHDISPIAPDTAPTEFVPSETESETSDSE